MLSGGLVFVILEGHYEIKSRSIVVSFGRKGLEPRALAEMLAEYDIQPRPIRPSGSTGSMVRGYRREDFRDAWERHPSPIKSDVTGVTPVTDEEDVTKPEC